MDGATLAVLLIIAYFVVSPDPVSLSLTRGAKGAAGKAVGRRWAARSGIRGGNGKRRGTTLRQGVRQAWADGREAAAAAKARRAEGRDTYSQLVRAGRAAGTAIGVAYATGGTVRERVHAGWQAGAAHWRDIDGRRRVSASADNRIGSTDTAATSSAGPAADTTDATDRTAGQTSADPVDRTDATDTTAPINHTNTATPDKNPDKEGNNAMDMTELESLEAVRREARQAMEMSESLTEVVTSIKDWATGLADRWSGTEWGTKDLDHAVADVGDAAGTLASGEALTEALVAIEDAVKRAEALGEVASEIGAHGDVDAFRAA